MAPPAVRAALTSYMTQRFADRDFGNLRRDLDVFGKLASGDLDVDLYKYIMALSGFEGGRRDFKKTFFQSLYGEVYVAQNLPTWTSFQETFPDLAGEIDLAKAENYRILPCLMQMIEGHAMFHHVAPRLMERGFTFFTLHDAVFSPASAITDVKTIMKESLASCGLHPTLAIEDQQEQRVPRLRPITSQRRKTRRKSS